MKAKLSTLTFLAIALFGMACSEATSTNTSKKEFFFDIATYIDSEVAKIDTSRTFKKTTSFNGQTEKVEVTGADLGKELAIFKKATINKAAFVDMYVVDTIMGNGQILSLLHTAISEKVKVKSLSIDFDKNSEVSKIEITKANDSAISKINQKLIYDPKAGYKIESLQDIALIDPNAIKVEVEF